MKINKTLDGVEIIKSLPFFFLCVLIAYPILPYVVQSITIVLLFISSVLIYWNKLKENINKMGLTPFLFISGWFMFLVITLLYSTNLDEGIKRILKGINLIVFPILFIYILPKFSLKNKNILYDIFIYTHVFLIFFLLFKSFEGIDRLGFPDDKRGWVRNISDEGYLELLKVFFRMPFSHSRYFINENEITTFFVHKAYLSIGLVWSVFLLMDRLFFQKMKKIKSLLFLFLLILFTISIIYFTSIPNIIALLVLLPIFLFLKISGLKKRLILIILLLVSIFSLSQINIVKERVFNDMRLKKDIGEVISLFQTIFNDQPKESANIRLDVWSCSYKQIKKNIWFGYGIGDEEQILLDCYKEINCKDCLEQNLNAHNYYAYLLLTGGVSSLLLFLLAFSYMFKIGIKSKNYLFLVFIVLLFINLMSENMLVRIHGVLFYVVFSSLLFSESYVKLIKQKEIV